MDLSWEATACATPMELLRSYPIHVHVTGYQGGKFADRRNAHSDLLATSSCLRSTFTVYGFTQALDAAPDDTASLANQSTSGAVPSLNLTLYVKLESLGSSWIISPKRSATTTYTVSPTVGREVSIAGL